MDWLESHKAVIDYLHKNFSSVDEEDKYHTLKEIYRALSTWKISALQRKKCIRKGCQLYGIKIKEIWSEKPKIVLKQYPILKKYQDFFLDKIPGVAPKHDLDFTIYLM